VSEIAFLIIYSKSYTLKPYLTFETDRLLLRPTEEGDADFILALLNTDKWLKYIGDRQVYNSEDAIQYIRQRMTPQLERLGYSNYTLLRKADGAKMGVCGLYDRDGLTGVDLGFAILPDYEGQGYSYEASYRMLQAGLEDFGLKQINAITTTDNIASQKLLEKLGFQYVRMISVKGDEEELRLYEFKSLLMGK
ncbi:MAG: GNAT family N-acetyltransferase, partial [Bacteroidota bacterium]